MAILHLTTNTMSTSLGLHRHSVHCGPVIVVNLMSTTPSPLSARSASLSPLVIMTQGMKQVLRSSIMTCIMNSEIMELDCNSVKEGGQKMSRGCKCWKEKIKWSRKETRRPEILIATKAESTYPKHTALILQLHMFLIRVVCFPYPVCS